MTISWVMCIDVGGYDVAFTRQECDWLKSAGISVETWARMAHHFFGTSDAEQWWFRKGERHV